MVSNDDYTHLQNLLFNLNKLCTFTGAVMSMFAGLISIVIRAMLSKIVAKEEIAKVFTFLACGEG